MEYGEGGWGGGIVHKLQVQGIDALDQNIERETFGEFRLRVVKTLLEISANVIDRIIASMPKRIDSIIRARGERLKY